MILLDTHAWLWWLGAPEKLGPQAAPALARAVEEQGVFISAISAWEVAMLVKKGRLELDRSPLELLRATEAMSFVHVVELDAAIAMRSVDLDLPHPDPADRFIAATAQWLGCPLETADTRLRETEWLATVW